MSYRVVHVASGREWRGGQNQVRLLAGALARRGDIEQLVITGRGTELARRLQSSAIPLRTPGWGSSLDPRVLIATIRESRRGSRHNHTTILHAHDAHALVLAGVAARFTGARLVVTRRVDFHLRRPGFWVRADKVIAISDAVRTILVEDGVGPERIAVVHSGIDVAEVRAAPRFDIRRQLGLSGEAKIAVNVAALVGHKDQSTLVAAAMTLRGRRPELHWVVAGEGPLREALAQQIVDGNVTDRVHLLGSIPNAWGLIAESDVVVMSSREDGLGTSVLDALALGVPVAATRAGGIPEILADGAGLLVPTGDATALAGAVEILLTDREQRATVLAAGARTLARFSSDAMADGILAVYRSLNSNG
jgi:glycosyltransferase involved in cell wall biosynthesis